MWAKTIGWTLLAGALLLPGSEALAFQVLAQHEASALSQPVTKYDVKDADVIEAPLPTGPDRPITGRIHATLPNLIKVRESFREKVLESGTEL